MSEGELNQNQNQNQNEIDGFQIVNTIYQGSNTRVLEVSDGAVTYAMKILLPEPFKDPEQKQILKREAKIAKSLEHPNLVQFQKVVFTKVHGYMLMDFFRGVSLKLQISNDLVGLHSRIRKLVDGMCLALGYMHDKGWVHKDVKPDNILFNKSSELKLVDYSLTTGTANVLSKMFISKNKEIQGTRTYIAPETIRRKPETSQTDMYSLGVTLFEVITGDLPFKGITPSDLLKKHVTEAPPDPSSINPNVTPEMDRFILRLLAKNPKKRHSSMDAVHAEFRALQPFKEDVQELAKKMEEEAHQKELESLSAALKLDSRSDAKKSSLRESGELKDDPDSKPVSKVPRPVASVQPQQPLPQQPQMPPQPYMPPNAPVASQQPPMPQQPGVPPQQYPVQPMPPQPIPPQQVPPQQVPPQQGMAPQAQPPVAPPAQPQQPVPQQQQPAAPAAPATPPNTQPEPPASSPQPAQPTEASKENTSDDDLPFMDELPDVL